MIYAFSHTALVIILTALTAYPLTIKDFPLRKGITIFITITMFFSGGAIPTYLLMKELHLINNPLVMVVPFVVTAYNLILFRTFFEGIDPCMRESARIDGAGEFRILIQIIMPLSKAIIAAVSLFTIVGKWNDWYSALIYLNSEAYYPVQMILRKILFNSTVLLRWTLPSCRCSVTARSPRQTFRWRPSLSSCCPSCVSTPLSRNISPQALWSEE
ncbi:MAG: carbohydrate ABC transporter permease [Lachnospiraceae bacterium]